MNDFNLETVFYAQRAGKQAYRYDFYTRVFNNLKTQTVVREEQCELLLQVSPLHLLLPLPRLFMSSDGLINSPGWLISVWMYALSRGSLAGRQVCGPALWN